MGNRNPGSNLVCAGLLATVILLSCGQFVGFQDRSAPDVGSLARFDLYLGREELKVLYDSVTSDLEAVCRFNSRTMSGNGLIKVRGLRSRVRAKKSFTLEYINDSGREIKLAIDAGGYPWFEYNLAMKAYKAIGLPAPQLEPVALFLNNEYLGYYCLIPLYDEELQVFYGDSGELFKVTKNQIGEEDPLDANIEKKFPHNNDFSSLNRLYANVSAMNSVDWVRWMEQNVALEDMARYMAVRDFFGVRDTFDNNFYIYIDSKSRVLPWDNDRGFTDAAIGGNNILTRRMLESAVFKAYYIEYLERFFLVPGPENLLADLQADLDFLEALLDDAARISPASYYMLYSDFLLEYSGITDFLANRPGDILGSQEWINLNL